MRYVTRDGVELEVGRVDRRVLDAVYIPEPVPPSRVVESWGSVSEQVPDYSDPVYRVQLLDYHLKLAREILDVLAAAITLIDAAPVREKISTLEMVVGVQPNLETGFLRYGVDNADRAAIVELALYLSTVTQRGIDEAVERFNYKWRDKPVLTWHVPMSYGERGKLAVEWRAAQRSALTWAQFCALSGPEQSQHVAFWMLEDRLSYLLQAN